MGAWAQALAVLAVSLGGPQSPSRPQETTTYRIATVAWAGWSPLHVAEVSSFWTQQGLNVEVVSYDDPGVVLEAVRAGRIDFAMDMVGSLVGLYMDGVPVVALMETNWSHGGDKIIVRQGHHLADHQGEPLGVFLNLPSCLYFLNQYLATQQLTVSDFRIVQLKPEDLTDQFIAGRLPAIVNYDPHALRATNQGRGLVLANSAQYEGCIPECLWAYRERLRTIPPAHVRAILRGWIQAAEWVQAPQNWPRFRKILNERTFAGVRTYSDDELRQLMSAVRIHTPADLVARNRSGGGLYEYLQSLRHFLRENDLLRKDFNARDVFDNRFALDVLEVDDE